MADNGRGKLISFRADRLGARLISLVNTMRMADSFGLPFVVHWRDSDGLEDPTELFSRDFVRDHFIDKHEFQRLRDRATPLLAVLPSQTRATLLAHLDDDRHIVVDPVFDVQFFPFERPDEVRASFLRQVEALPLNPLLAGRLSRMRAQVKNGRRSIAYHIRRGDLTADRRAMNRAWPNKFVPDEFFEAHMRANLDQDARVFLFSDNASVLDRYSREFPDLVTFEQLAGNEGLTPVQRDALELFTMAMVDQIIAPPSSAFSSTAKTIGGAAFSDVESQLPEAARAVALDRMCQNLAERPESFANVGEIGQYLVYAMNHLVGTGRRADFIALARSHVESGLNIAFLHADLFREMFLDGQYEQICELRRVVDRGYVHFSRSFAQVALYHGAALLMLGRHDEAIPQLTSAVWHEPVEGEIDALAGALAAQGLLGRGNFWFSDPQLDRMFANRFALGFARKYFAAALQADVLRIERPATSCRLLVWEWIDFTRSDLRKKYRYKGHFRAALKVLARHTWPPERQPHLDGITGLVHLHEGNIDRAEALLLSAVAAKPQNSLFHKRVAELRLEQGRFDQALAAIDRAIALEPAARLYGAMRALILSRAGDPRGAATTLMPLLGGTGLHFPSLYYLAADSWREAGEMDRAVDALRAALALEPMHWRRQLDLAGMLAGLGHIDEAIPVLDWTLGWADDHPPMVTGAAQLLADHGRMDLATGVLDRAIAAYPDKPQYQRLLARLKREAERTAKPAAKAGRAMKLRPAEPDPTAVPAKARKLRGGAGKQTG